eukprot:jgi/Galph1/370/GphlegSOOS_G5096.1
MRRLTSGLSSCSLIKFLYRTYDQLFSCFTYILLYVIKFGPIPKHLAIIMDGNRRWATKRGLAAFEGHPWGSQTLTKALQWCYDSGIEQLTLFAFSIENYKRPENEKQQLFVLTAKKLEEMLDSKDIIQRYKIRVVLVGNLCLVPSYLLQLMLSVMKETAQNDGPRLTICFSYTARDEICSAIVDIMDDVMNGKLQTTDISEALLTEHIARYQQLTSEEIEPEIILRTSGETRLSDFLLWQSSYSLLYFTDRLWPDFSIFDFIRMLFWYQRHWRKYQCLLEQRKQSLMD